MKTFQFLFCIIFLIYFSLPIRGQVNQVTITDLMTPVSPGFIISDQTPSSVNRPTNTKAFVASLLSLNNGGSLEAAPYWLINSKSRDRLSYKDYVKKISPVLQTFSISATSFKSDTGSFLSVGVRFFPIRIHKSELNDKIAEIESLLSVPPLSFDTTAINKARRELKEIDKRPKFVIEIAGALLGYAPTNGYEQLKRSRSGGWANISYKPKALSLTGLVRYINNKQQGSFSENSDILDLGFSLGGENRKKNLSLNAELLFRKDYLLAQENHRFVVVANYKVLEQLYVVGSIGKNFSKVDNIIALLGINIGLSTKDLKLF